MLAKNLPATGKSEAETSPCLAAGEKRVEQVFAFDFIKSRSVVRNEQDDGVGIASELNLNSTTVLQGFQTVSNQT